MIARLISEVRQAGYPNRAALFSPMAPILIRRRYYALFRDSFRYREKSINGDASRIKVYVEDMRYAVCL